jgi:hypothetical protein
MATGHANMAPAKKAMFRVARTLSTTLVPLAVYPCVDVSEKPDHRTWFSPEDSE